MGSGDKAAAAGGERSGKARRRPARRPAVDDPARAERDAKDVADMLAFKKGDARAFERLVQRHQKSVFNFCLRMLGHREAAQDATQEVFLKVVRNAKNWERNAKLTTWIFTIARNHCIDALRKASYRKTASLDQPLKSSEESGAALVDRVADESAPTPDRGAESLRMRTLLAEAIRSLSEEQREVFVMREYAGMPFKEIASVVGVPENTVKSRMRYALEHLRAHLAQKGVKPGTT